jgi:hypothetical protein
MAKIDGGKLKSGALGKEVASSLADGSSAVLIVGVVEEIIMNPESFGPDTFADRVEDKKVLADIPANSLLVRVLTEKEYKNSKKLTLCHPIFPTHFQLPVKVGEHVFFIKYGNIGYWLCRVPDSRSVEDANYAHGDRKHMHATSDESTIDQAKQEEGSKGMFIGLFNNGAEAEDTQSFSPDDSYEKIFETTFSTGSFVPEPVPFYKKSPGDLVFQGSNNTLICLGTNRGWTKAATPADFEIGTNAYFEVPEDLTEAFGKGAIDIVVGRGRFPPDKPTTKVEVGDDPVRTATRTSQNARDLLEADRVSIMNELPVNPVEGDPDYEYDAARILLSMKAAFDDDFHILKDPENTELLPTIPSWPDGPKPADDGSSLEPIADSSYSLIKSDEIRIIARRQEENMNGEKDGIAEINGSIKIIKEGVRNSEAGDGQAVILMQPDGTIMIDGPTVVIGSGHADLEKPEGEGTQIILGRGAEEPLVLGTALKDLLDAHFADLKTYLSSVFDVHIHPTGVGPSGPPTVPATSLASSLNGSKSDLIKILSKYGKLK